MCYDNRRKTPIYEKVTAEKDRLIFIFFLNYFVTDGLFISININSVAINEDPKTKVWN